MRKLLLVLLLCSCLPLRLAGQAAGSLPAGAGGGAAGGPNNIIAANFGVQGTGKVCMDGTVTSSSATITSAGQCVWTSADIGSLIWATNACSPSQCGFTLLHTSTTILPSTQVTTARIATINSSSSITVDCNAPATCSSPNASATNTGHATIIYGNPQTTALNAAGAAYAQSQGCPNLVLPQGLIIFNSALWTTLPSGSTANSCNNGVSSVDNVISYNGAASGWLEGQGMSATILVPTPDTFANAGSCGGALINKGQIFQAAKDLSISGFGQSFHVAGVATTCGPLIQMAGGFLNTTLSGFANQVSGVGGWSSGGGNGFAAVINTQIIDFGGVNNQMVVFAGSSNYAIGSAFLGEPITITGNLTSSDSIFPCNTGAGVASVDVSGSWISKGDSNSSWNQAAAADDVKIENGGFADLDGWRGCGTANSNGIETVAGGTLILHGARNAALANKFLTNAGTTFDLGGNVPVAGTITNTGNVFGNYSIIGTVPAAGNFALTNATFSSVAGNDQKHFTLNITASAAAAVTIAYTFPTTFWQTPGSCRAQQIGGTQPVLTFTDSVLPTTTAVTFLSTAAAVNTDTLQIAIDCQ